MGISFNPIFIGKTQSIRQLKYNIDTFGKVDNVDTFQNNSVANYFDENFIRASIAKNPEITNILTNNKMPLHLNMKELEELKIGHCKATQNICAEIAKNLPPSLKPDVNIAALKDAALLHDIGKVLIPPEILNKKGILTKEEHTIMELHSELGYQLLKNNIKNQEVLNLVRYHHNLNGGKNYIPDVNTEILNLADKYSALTEKRVYKDAFSPQQALTILYQDVQKGVIHPQIYYALVKSVTNTASLRNVKIS